MSKPRNIHFSLVVGVSIACPLLNCAGKKINSRKCRGWFILTISTDEYHHHIGWSCLRDSRAIFLYRCWISNLDTSLPLWSWGYNNQEPTSWALSFAGISMNRRCCVPSLLWAVLGFDTGDTCSLKDSSLPIVKRSSLVSSLQSIMGAKSQWLNVGTGEKWIDDFFLTWEYNRNKQFM